MDQAGAPTAAHDLAGRPTLSPRSPEQVAFQEAVTYGRVVYRTICRRSLPTRTGRPFSPQTDTHPTKAWYF